MINGTQFMNAIGCEALILAENVLRSNEILLSFFMEMFGYPAKLLSEEYESRLKNKTSKSLIRKMRQKNPQQSFSLVPKSNENHHL